MLNNELFKTFQTPVYSARGILIRFISVDKITNLGKLVLLQFVLIGIIRTINKLPRRKLDGFLLSLICTVASCLENVRVEVIVSINKLNKSIQ
jgi:hypothetical protein